MVSSGLFVCVVDDGWPTWQTGTGRPGWRFHDFVPAATCQLWRLPVFLSLCPMCWTAALHSAVINRAGLNDRSHVAACANVLQQQFGISLTEFTRRVFIHQKYSKKNSMYCSGSSNNYHSNFSKVLNNLQVKNKCGQI